MNFSELQAELRHFAVERDWQPFHTPKNLATALLVEAAELAEIFQWMTPEESQGAHQLPPTKERIGEEVADVLLYLLQVADHSEIDIASAVKDKLSRNAQKYPAKRSIARSVPASATPTGTHVLLDYENVQPTEDDLRELVPDASQVWVFHGPHQREIQKRFASFGDDVTAVPISKTGKNALDFHLSFYMGYLASRNQSSQIVVVANDKGYGPMLEHAKGMGFAVCQRAHGIAPQGKSTKPTPAGKAVPVAKPTAKKAAAKPAKQALGKPAAKKGLPTKKTATSKAPAKKSAATPPSVSAALIDKITRGLRKMGDARPVKPASLRGALKSLLAVETGDASIEVALRKLVATGVVSLDEAKSQVAYPTFATPTETRSANA